MLMIDDRLRILLAARRRRRPQMNRGLRLLSLQDWGLWGESVRWGRTD
jgi:hypothetical protein